jgi:hypothetical protein
MRWFALLDTEGLMPLGEHEDFNSADEVAPGNTVWLWNEDALRRLRDNAVRALGDAPGTLELPEGGLTVVSGPQLVRVYRTGEGVVADLYDKSLFEKGEYDKGLTAATYVFDDELPSSEEKLEGP